MNDQSAAPATQTDENSFAGVRVAHPSDQMNIFNYLLMLYEENALFTIASEKVWDAIRIGTEGKGGIIGLIDGPRGIEGSVGLYLEAWWYTNDFSLNEKWNFVHPDHRKSLHAQRLIEFSKWCSRRLQVPLHMGIISNKRTEAKVRLYRRKLPYCGAFFMYGSDKMDHPDGREK